MSKASAITALEELRLTIRDRIQLAEDVQAGIFASDICRAKLETYREVERLINGWIGREADRP